MVANIVSQCINGEDILVNSKGCEEIEFELNDICTFSESPKDRYIALYKRGMLRLTLASYKEIKRELIKRGLIWRFNNSKR